MKKILLGIGLSSALLLGACNNSDAKKEEDKKEEVQNLSPEKQEEIYKKETKKMVDYLTDTEMEDDMGPKDVKSLNKVLDRYKDKTKNLDQVETEIGDYTYKTLKTVMAFTERTNELDKFKKDNPDLKETYELAYLDVSIEMMNTLETIQMDFEDFDIEYKKEYLGKEATEELTDILAEVGTTSPIDVANGYGEMIAEYSESPNEDQKKILSNTDDYRKVMNEQMITEEPDVSKHDYNESVEVFNKYAPDFLHRDKVDKMVSATESSYMTHLRNGAKGAGESSEYDSFDDAEDEVESELDDDLTSDSESTEDEDVSSEDSEDKSTEDTSGWSAESYNELVDEYNSLTDGEKMDHVDEDVLDIEYEQLEERVANLK